MKTCVVPQARCPGEIAYQGVRIRQVVRRVDKGMQAVPHRSPPDIRLKRAYDDVADDDGMRILVERLWPRGVKRETAAVEHWFKGLAPSPDLRRWYNHQPERWPEFRLRYEAELDAAEQSPMDQLTRLCQDNGVTFIFAARDTERNSAVVLRDYMLAKLGRV